MTCEGFYADVQWLGVSDEGEGTREQQWVQLNGRLNRDEEELNKKKILELVNEYNAFKRGNVRHFKFNAQKTEDSFGEISVIL